MFCFLLFHKVYWNLNTKTISELLANWAWKLLPNKKVLLRERKRHTARRVASARYADLSGGGVPRSMSGGVCHSRSGGVPHPRSRGGGYPIPYLGGYPVPCVRGVPHPRSGGYPGYPPSYRPDWGTPHLRPEMGYPPSPTFRPGRGTPPQIPSSCHPSDAGGN